MAVFLRKKGKIKKVSDGRRPSVCWPPGNDAILPVTTETTMETVYRGPRPTPPTDTTNQPGPSSFTLQQQSQGHAHRPM